MIVPVRGDSMEPTIYDGDKIYIKQQPEIRLGDIGLFMIDGSVYVKELAADGLISHNPKYGKIEFTPNTSIYCYGKFLGVKHI